MDGDDFVKEGHVVMFRPQGVLFTMCCRPRAVECIPLVKRDEDMVRASRCWKDSRTGHWGTGRISQEGIYATVVQLSSADVYWGIPMCKTLWRCKGKRGKKSESWKCPIGGTDTSTGNTSTLCWVTGLVNMAGLGEGRTDGGLSPVWKRQEKQAWI